MRYISNYKRFLNENKAYPGGLHPDDIELNEDEHKKLGSKIMDWMDKNSDKVPNVLNSLMQWVSRNHYGLETEVIPGGKGYPPVWANMRIASPNDFPGNLFRYWVYFIGCKLTKDWQANQDSDYYKENIWDNPDSYDALRVSLGTEQGRYKSKKTARLRSNDPNTGSATDNIFSLVRNKIRDSQDRKAAEEDERLKVEVMLLDDKGFEELIKVCQEIVAKSGVEKQVNVETNDTPSKQSQQDEPTNDKPSDWMEN